VGCAPKFLEEVDGSIRVADQPLLCLRTGADRPDRGSELRLERCSFPPPKDSATRHLGSSQPHVKSPTDVGVSRADLSAVMEEMFQRMEARFDTSARLEHLEQQIAELQSHNVASTQSNDSSVSQRTMASTQSDDASVPELTMVCNSTDPICPMLAKTRNMAHEDMEANL